MELTDDSILVMKVGFHGDESLHDILLRKNMEVAKFGHTYWGYGGVLCHPTRVVQHVAQQDHSIKAGGIRVLFSVTPSPFESSDVEPLSHMSLDGVSWTHLPAGAVVTASRYALVVGRIDPIESAYIDLSKYTVATGPSEGRSLKDYLRFRVDKAVARRASSAETEPKILPIAFTASLVAPFAILVGREPPPSSHQGILALH